MLQKNKDTIDLASYAERAYLEYAMSVVKGRALPAAYDGQKPVQRRILYAMRDMNLTHTAKPVKSARVVGEILGKYHPHGDSSAYEAMVRMAQDFTLRYPLVDGQGNFGSRDGDNAAAMRYCFVAGTRIMTEAGLRPLEQMVDNEVLQKALSTPNTHLVQEISQQVASLKDLATAVRWVYSGVQDTVIITTKNGYTTQCTPNEPFLVLTKDLEYKWVAIEDLVVGDKICMQGRQTVTVPGGQSLFQYHLTPDEIGKCQNTCQLPTNMSEELALILGSIASDGYVRDKTGEVCFSSTDKDSMYVFTTCFKKVFPELEFTVNPVRQSKSGFQSRRECREFVCNSIFLCKFLRKLGYIGEDSYSVRVPEVIFQSGTEEVAVYLRAYYDGDGSVSGQGGCVDTALCSVNKSILEDVKQLLLGYFGIISGKIYSEPNRPLHYLHITSLQENRKFRNHIGFISLRKRLALAVKCINERNVGAPSSRDTIPHINDYVDSLVKESLERDGSKMVGRVGFERLPSNRARLENRLGAMATTPMREIWPEFFAKTDDIVERGYFYAEIESIEQGGQQPVFDLTVEGTHAFVANGFIAHNTEARLTPISELLLGEIDKGTVKFRDNYDGTHKEPEILPARLPFVLLNGSSGIAVGMATEMPPHNLRDVSNALIALIDKPKIKVEDLVTILQGPDFPGGGQIISDQETIAEAYITGRGSIRVRARYTFENYARGQWALVINELPPGVSSKKILDEIEEYTNPKLKPGKKALSIEQVQTKQSFLAILEKVSDASDSKEPIRLVFEPKTSKINRDEFVKVIMSQTSLEVNVSVNMTMIDNSGKPRTFSLKDVLCEFMDARYNVVINRSNARLDILRRRQHLLEGRKIAFLNLDKVIKVIREADDPKTDLMKKFKMTEQQAEDILEIRLRQLSRLEGFKLDQELQSLISEIDHLDKMVKSPARILTTIKKEILEDTKKFGDNRRTLIKADAKTVLTRVVKDEPVNICVTKNNWIRLGTITPKNGDSVSHVIESRTIWPINVLDSNGKAYTIMPEDLVGLKSEGLPITSLINIGSGKVVAVIADDPKTPYIFASDAGYGFSCRLEALQSRLKAGKQFISVHGDEVPVAPVKYDKGDLVSVTKMGRMNMFKTGDLPVLKGGRGLQLIQRHNNSDKVICMGVSKDKKFVELTYLTNRGTQSKTKVEKKEYQMKRGGRGKPLARELEVVLIE